MHRVGLRQRNDVHDELSGRLNVDEHVIVVGNAIEKEPSLIKEMAAAVHSVPVKEV